MLVFLPDVPRFLAWTGVALDPRGGLWQPAPGRLPVWRPTPHWAGAIAVVGALAVVQMSRVMEFIYYRF